MREGRGTARAFVDFRIGGRGRDRFRNGGRARPCPHVPRARRSIPREDILPEFGLGDFGFSARVPLGNVHVDRTEVDAGTPRLEKVHVQLYTRE